MYNKSNGMEALFDELLNEIESGNKSVHQALKVLNKYPPKEINLLPTIRPHWITVQFRYNWFVLWIPVFIPLMNYIIKKVIVHQVSKNTINKNDGIALYQMIHQINNLNKGNLASVLVIPNSNYSNSKQSVIKIKLNLR